MARPSQFLSPRSIASCAACARGASEYVPTRERFSPHASESSYAHRWRRTGTTGTTRTTRSTRTLAIEVVDTKPIDEGPSNASSVRVESLVTGTGSSRVPSGGGPLVNVLNQALVDGPAGHTGGGSVVCARNIPAGYGDPTDSKRAAYSAACPSGPR